jgi:hypothetical protein
MNIRPIYYAADSSATDVTVQPDASAKRYKQILEAELSKTTIKTGVNIDSLAQLLVDSGMDQKEVRKILLQSDKNQALGQLWMLALLIRIQNKKQLSARYDAYLKTVVDILKSGRIKVVLVAAKYGQVNQSAGYDLGKDTLTLNIFESYFSDPEAMQTLESVAVHELYHAYQDNYSSVGTRTEVEASAYLVQGDYLAHVSKTYSDNWVKVEYEPTMLYGYRFNPARSLVMKALEKPAESVEVKDALNTIKEKYAGVLSYIYACTSKEVAEKTRELIAQFNSTGDQTAFFKLIMDKIAKGKGLPDHSVLLGKTEGELAPKQVMVDFLSAMEYMVTATMDKYQKRHETKDLKDAQEFASKAYAIFIQKVITYVPGDKIIRFNGIKK